MSGHSRKSPGWLESSRQWSRKYLSSLPPFLQFTGQDKSGLSSAVDGLYHCIGRLLVSFRSFSHIRFGLCPLLLHSTKSRLLSTFAGDDMYHTVLQESRPLAVCSVGPAAVQARKSLDDCFKLGTITVTVWLVLFSGFQNRDNNCCVLSWLFFSPHRTRATSALGGTGEQRWPLREWQVEEYRRALQDEASQPFGPVLNHFTGGKPNQDTLRTKVPDADEQRKDYKRKEQEHWAVQAGRGGHAVRGSSKP